MKSEIQELAQKRLRWVESNRENGFEDGIKKLLTDLYPDNAHFIYELLQNAEDTAATEVEFILSENDLKFEHNGERLFDRNDIESITSIGESTKINEPTKIGKFGVGFKAVFSYTNSPEIYSGEYHFSIKDLVVPSEITNGILTSNKNNTLFRIPFNHPKKQHQKAREEIGQGLKKLDATTLLFLKHIRSIKYTLPDGSTGSLERLTHERGIIEVCVQNNNSLKDSSNWLRYEKEVEVIDSEAKMTSCWISIAYRLEKEVDPKKESIWKIVPCNPGLVSIYFPAEKETSNLKFHIHAPFASTVARDSIRTCADNDKLRDHISRLAVESLHDIRVRGMLATSFLAVLPNPTDNLSPFYEEIRRKIVEAFQTSELTPTKSGMHAPSKTLYEGSSKFSQVLDDEKLSQLTQSKTPLWVVNAPQQNQPEDRFIKSLEIRSWDWKELFSNNVRTTLLMLIQGWISTGSDEWIKQFYSLMGDACKWMDAETKKHYFYPENPNFPNEIVKSCGLFIEEAKKLTVVRVKAEAEHDHVVASKAFFAPDQENSSTANTAVYFVKTSLYKENINAQLFLEKIGVRPYDEKNIIERMLEKYDHPPKQIDEQHFCDLKHFIEYLEKHPNDIEPFKAKSFFIGESSDGNWYWTNPIDLYIDSPYEDTGLRELTSVHKKKALSTKYKEKLEVEKLLKFSKEIGVMSQLEIIKVNVRENPLFHVLEDQFRGKRWTDTSSEKDFSIENLEDYIKTQNITASRLIWNALIKADKKVSKAEYSPNQKHSPGTIDSQLVYHLKRESWIPDRSGNFCKPQNITEEDLHKDFSYDNQNELLTAIEFGEKNQKSSNSTDPDDQAAKKLGFESKEDAKKAKDLLERLNKKPKFPKRPVADPDHRRGGVVQIITNAPHKSYEPTEISVRTSSGKIDPIPFLRENYTNEDGEMVCQICKYEMPFRKRDGKHYFEKREILSSKHFTKEDEKQFMALCPVCAAKYTEFVINDKTAMAQLRSDILNSADDSEVPLKLGDESTSIQFVETHLFDLQKIIKSYESQQNQSE